MDSKYYHIQNIKFCSLFSIICSLVLDNKQAKIETFDPELISAKILIKNEAYQIAFLTNKIKLKFVLVSL